MKTLAVLALLLLACRVSAVDPPVDALKELSDSWVRLRADMTALQSLTRGQAAKLEEQEAKLKGQQTEIEKLKEGAHVAFSASLVATGDQTLGPFPGHTLLVFKHVVTNIGYAYSPVTGAFTAPLRGAYHFEWHVIGSGGRTGAVLVKNSKDVFSSIETQKSPRYNSASQGASLLLEAGDVVAVRLWAGASVFDNTGRYTTFSGHLLFTV